MGVHELWSIVEPVRESVPLYSLSGKTLAVDLSLWVNLFFRVSSLTLMGVKLVFVMEGEAPKIKAETMSKRTEQRFGGLKKASAPKTTSNTSRGRFNAVLRECAAMLDYLGVPWVTAAGEAEAMCAYLDSEGLVDGCITNDGDAFLYGARTVYRNFNLNSKVCLLKLISIICSVLHLEDHNLILTYILIVHSYFAKDIEAVDPQVDCYKTSRVHTDLNISRENLVGLAVFLGCDYIPKGIPGVGREQSLKLIQMLKGQTILQRFTQWKEDNAGVSEGVLKKVPHCHLCRHPGSAKAHERKGCVLCDSNHFCQPQDFDYQCPCDWHRFEETRQAVSLEANIRKKTLASQLFPFTEIIKEFLISKDKPVSQFKRRQPNLMLIQKFAYDKMEWPKHYTSEKALVLMTYSELMNRKYGREMSSQIKPLRIFKPRVRNAVACFEIVWRTPEHYVFPEDRPAEDQHEVRTVEEESLFRVAFPEVVESYLRDKALAEENKTKKKKPKSKKEKPSDVSDGISDLLAQMTIQTSSNTEPQKLPASNPDDLEVVVLDTPVNHKQRQKSKEEHSSLGDCPKTPLSHAGSEAAAASPSVSDAIDALHLSDIDWEALSFTSSPTPQSTINHTTEPKLRETTDSDVIDERIELKVSNDVVRADSRSEVCFTECPLRDRLLMKNTARAMDLKEKHNDEISKQLNYELASLKKILLITHTQNQMDRSPIKEPLTEQKQSATNKAETHSSQPRLTPIVQSKTKDNGPQKPPQKYKFVRKAISSSTLAPQRCNSDPVQSDRNALHSTKKSVCMSVCLSSEESDAENKQTGPQRKAYSKHTNKMKGNFLSAIPLKLKTTKPTAKAAPTIVQSLQPKAQSCSADIELKSRPVATQSKSQDVPPAHVDGGVFPQTPGSPAVVLDSDDSIICVESPLPLAERLRLKFMK
ncbi:hypothetical protein F7725_019643 [Dissostichus mawsoni]|uniref:Flap endonuclease GEN homolog 1 n=1 Tax=Dissostichus mawsoni TaxID=36200 RepID=A0A7J5YKB1_DISMA|nr:hypothetical protein F7725_019643 [Dissostichus mawsoni]